MARAVRMVVLGLGLCGVCLCAGCYSRVVKSSGLGGVPAQPSYRSDTALDRAYDNAFGGSEKSFKGADNMPVTGKSRWTADSTGGGIQRPSSGGTNGH